MSKECEGMCVNVPRINVCVQLCVCTAEERETEREIKV